ncbi:MAG: hypothetical protein OXU70_11130 [Gammaproteobacteria bacterium]|nr:hypothetical protein [Gammaproteobacteria bacterium]
MSICPADDSQKITGLLSHLKAHDDELADIGIDDVICRPLIDGQTHQHLGATVKVEGRVCQHVHIN